MLLLAVLIAVAACDAPVRVGVQEARAAGMNVGYTPGTAVRSAAVLPAAPASRVASFSSSLLFLPPIPQPQGPDDIVGLKLERSQGTGPVTFGQIFIPGQLQPDSGLAARIDGHDMPAQLDVKTTNPDGSVRFGIVTLIAAVPADVMLVRHAADTGARVDLSRLSDYDLGVDLTMHDAAGDVTHHFSVAKLLSDVLHSGKTQYWLRGPLASEVRVTVPVESSLRLTCDVRGYADGTMFTDVQFNNDVAMQPVGGTARYDVTISLHGKPVFRHAGIEQYQYQTWHHEIWSSTDPQVNVVHDVAVMERAGAVWNYDLKSGVREARLLDEEKESSKPGFADILGSAAITRYMPMTGGRRDIAPMPFWDGLWLVTQNERAARFALIQADAAGTVPWHMVDPATGTYMTLESWPKLWTDARGGNGPPGGLTQQIDGKAGWVLDDAHEPGLSYVAYMQTGLHYYLDQLDAQASWTILTVWPWIRQDGRGIVATKGSQLRGAAWGLRELVEAAYINPDSGPLTPYFRKLVRINFDYLLAEAKVANQGEVSGWLQGIYGEQKGAMAPWQQDFIASTVILAAEQGVGGAKQLLAWQANFLAGRFLSGDKGLSPYDGIAYNMVVWDKSPEQPYQSWHEIGTDVVKYHWSGGGATWHADNLEYYLAARGVLGGIVTVTGQAEAKQALAWVNAHPPPGFDPAWQPWDIVPERQ